MNGKKGMNQMLLYFSCGFSMLLYFLCGFLVREHWRPNPFSPLYLFFELKEIKRSLMEMCLELRKKLVRTRRSSRTSKRGKKHLVYVHK